jgi:hypothetical protein
MSDINTVWDCKKLGSHGACAQLLQTKRALTEIGGRSGLYLCCCTFITYEAYPVYFT